MYVYVHLIQWKEDNRFRLELTAQQLTRFYHILFCFCDGGFRWFRWWLSRWHLCIILYNSNWTCDGNKYILFTVVCQELTFEDFWWWIVKDLGQSRSVESQKIILQSVVSSNLQLYSFHVWYNTNYWHFQRLYKESDTYISIAIAV